MKRFLFVIFSAMLIIANASSTLASFTDVSKLNPHYNAIDYVQSEGIVSGYPDGTFKPDKLVNRAEFVKILVGSALDYNSSQDPSGYDIYALVGIDLTDIPNGEWYVPYVRKAIENGIIAGYPDKTFKPLNNINKAEAAKIIVKSFEIETLADSFNTNWYDVYIYALEEAGAAPTSLVCTNQNVTRGELAEMIYRVKTKLTSQESAHSYIKMASKLRFTYNASMNGLCDSKGTTLPASQIKETAPTQPSATEELMSEPITVTLDDSDVNNGSTMYDFDTGQRTNTNVYPDQIALQCLAGGCLLSEDE